MENLFELPPAAVPGDTSPSIEPDFSEPDKFDWSSDDSVLLGEQMATAVYRNRAEAIVIRQEGVGGDDDHFVVLRDADAVCRLVGALQREIGGDA